MTYQPTATTAGERSCVDRWDVIRWHLASLDEPFTVLDLGANAGWFSTRLAEEFDCQVTAIDDHRDLSSIASDRVTVLNRRVSARHLREMPRFDVVLALSVLHHMADWRAVFDQVRACRRGAFVEVPAPGEEWMRWAAARHELPAIHDKVAGAAFRLIGEFERTGRDGSVHQRPMFLVHGTLTTLAGTVFSGSGTCSRKLTPTLHARGLDRELGYQPYPGSLNLRCETTVDLGTPWLAWPGLVKGRSRPYWFWPAWLNGHPVHAMDPAGRGHGPGCIEVVAPRSMRDSLGLVDGDAVTLEVACG
jgi:CTP-dependent riboflavin kinase